MLGVQSGSRTKANAVGDGVGRPEDHDLGRHHAARRGFLVGQQTRHDLGLVVVHRLEDRRPLVDRHLAEQVGEVVVLHLVEHTDQAVEVEPFDQAQLVFLGQFLEHVGQPFVVHRLGQLTALRRAAGRAPHRPRRRGACRAVGRPRQPPRWWPRTALASSSQSTSRKLGRRRSDDRRARRTLAISHRRLRPSETSSRPRSLTRLVADRPVDQVGADQCFAGTRLERVEIDVPAPQPGPVAVEFGDPSGVDEDPAALAGGHEPDHAGRLAGSARHDDEILDLADLGPAGVEQRQAHHPKRVDQLACHTAQTTCHPSSAWLHRTASAAWRDAFRRVRLARGCRCRRRRRPTR